MFLNSALTPLVCNSSCLDDCERALHFLASLVFCPPFHRPGLNTVLRLETPQRRILPASTIAQFNWLILQLVGHLLSASSRFRLNYHRFDLIEPKQAMNCRVEAQTPGTLLEAHLLCLLVIHLEPSPESRIVCPAFLIVTYFPPLHTPSQIWI